MESLLKNLKEHVTCSICLDIFTEPKTITCLHTFCCECLKRHVLRTQRKGQFSCPECQAQVGVPESFDKLTTGFLQNSLLSLFAVQQSSDGSEISCGNCRKKSAETSFCFNCGKFMCPDCVNAHELLRNLAFDGHKVRPIKHFQAEDYEALLKRQTFCSQEYHEREVTRFFCIDCQTCVCQICINTDLRHKNHTFEPLDKAADQERVELMAALGKMEEKNKVCNNAIREFEQTAVNLKANITTAKLEVSQAAEIMITKIRELEREAITALEDTLEFRTEKLNSGITQVQSLAKQINQAIKFTNSLVQRSSSADVMQSKKSLDQRFEDLKKSTIPALSVYSYVKFVSKCEPENLTLGLMVSGEPDLNRSTVEGLTQNLQLGVQAEFVVCPKLKGEAADQGKFHVEVLAEPTEKVESLKTYEKEDGNFRVTFKPKMPGTYKIQVTINGEHFYKTPLTVQVKERRLEILGELDLKGETLQNPHGIAVNSKGLIAVSDFNGHCILIFDKEGKFLRKFGCKGMNAGELNGPSAVTYLSEEQILVADASRVQQFDVCTGEYVRAFGKEGLELSKLTSVCLDGQGRIVVGDFNNNRMQVFTEDGEPVFKFGDSGSGKLRDGPTGCVYHQDTFIVSDAKKNCLKVFDNTGRFLRKIGERGKGDGQLFFPQGLCVEKCGNHYNILVCDRDNKRIVQFSVEGYFIGKTVTKLQQPFDIATTPDGRILVSDFRAKTIYILK